MNAEAPHLYYQYVILRISQNLNRVFFGDIAFTFQFISLITSQTEKSKCLQAVETYIVDTDEDLLFDKKNTHVEALVQIYYDFAAN